MTLARANCGRFLTPILIGAMCLGACVPTSTTAYPVPPTQGYPGPATETAVPTAIPTTAVPPTETPVLTTQTPESMPTSTPIIDDGVYYPVPWTRLEYDQSKWQKRNLSPSDEIAWVIYWHEPALVHKSIKHCYLGANNPRDVGPGIEIRGREEMIGEHLFSVRELFSETDGGQLGAVVYDSDIAVEYREAGLMCIAEVKQVLATYTQVQP